MNKELILEEAVKVFADINSRIDLLIECSANDFVILNKGFMDYNSTINGLTLHTGELFDELLALPDNKLKSHRENIRKLIREMSEIYNLANTVYQSINQLVKDMGYAFLHVSNQKQHISTLKLLVTNIQLEPSSRSLYSELMEQINNLQAFNQKLTREFSGDEKRVQSCAESIESIRQNQLPAVKQYLELYDKMLDGLSEMKAQCLEYNKQLKSLNSKKSASSSEIITNLQFQDIIRQKIEHVQEAQEFLMDRLNQQVAKKPGDAAESSTSVLKVILQIRDIGTLQAAQMVHANEEYQKAVENITNKFEELDHILIEITHLLNNFSPSVNPDSNYSFEELLKTKSYLELEFDTLMDQCGRFERMNADMIRKDEILVGSTDRLNAYIKDCEKVFSKIKPEKVITSQKSDQVNISLEVSRNFETFLHNTEEMHKLLQLNHKKIEDHIENQLNRFVLRKNKFSKELKDSIKEIENILPMHKAKAQAGDLQGLKKDLRTKKFSTNEIQYYSVFDKEIEEIITNLNHLIGLIDFSKLEKELDLENLEEIKSLYTMESERKIHSTVTGEEKEENGTDTSELELF
ncbi:MAG: hypothetical protein JW801_12170 [Bacteroidales bacterium]|nr:hypothetical protein [Bacteroidales bacterium]